ncbi:leucine-rich repeat-containing protein 42-like [Dendronephthya gigantea]|uniref:leucine-rich repeat-containing protein 42-like n=1 Tax=Dendronephthya gigantea TaxID=151771 RepID=UPI00106C7A3C|nr:leucine-rich repeat-containing protein 42-like [Dendronephthya gigantea]
MSYQKRTSDECLNFEDASLVYVSDRHGVLTSPPGYEKSSAKKIVRECDVVHGASCVRQLSENRQSPRSLFQICKNFTTKNLHLLESLDDFPETIGHELFLEALQVESFHKNPAYLKIFCEAYKELVLKDLCLKEETILIDEFLPYFLCFNNLLKLDLSHCRLGNKHEYLNFIGRMKSLECLYLKDNCLTDSGLATWSLPYRMFNNGPQFLKILDLSCNPDLTCFCLKSLFKFSHLKCLNLSGTGVTMSPGIARFKKIMNFSLVSYIEEFSQDASTITSGWAASFISELSSKLNAQKNEWNGKNEL